ncbi:MAG TPA: hypothetical protein VM490_20165, partial [Armatimonadaceae bacterium]|nr:hypothetical protein [Armatimonadaceae bacterium]
DREDALVRARRALGGPGARARTAARAARAESAARAASPSGSQSPLPTAGLSQQMRDRVSKEPVVLLIRRISVSTGGAATPSDVARPGS